MKLSIILPTYNNEKTLKECLDSIFDQKASKKNFEVLLIDGGSNDNTLNIAKSYPVRYIKNEKRVEEAARIKGIKLAKGEILAFVDADNVLVGLDWIDKMLVPFQDKKIAFADTLYFSYRKGDKVGVRYQALIGGDDPFALYLGIFNRWSYLHGDWTKCPHLDEDKGEYLKSKLLNLEKVPPMGSNGFLVRKKLARKFIDESFIHSDFIYDLVNNGHNCFAKVKTGIVHNQPKFFPNKIRRIKRRLSGEIKQKHNYGVTKSDLVRVCLGTLLILPVIIDSFRGFVRKPDSAWLFHPIASFGELVIYGFMTIKHIIYKTIKF